MQKEEWRDIAGYEGLYQVSNLGNVKSLNYSRTGKEKILKQKLNKNGYYSIQLCNNRIRKMYLVHRLVAQGFILNPDKLPCVNHIDENKQNNCVDNLEFCSVAYNNAYGTRNEKSSTSRFNHPELSTPIKCLDLETNKETYFPSIMEAKR